MTTPLVSIVIPTYNYAHFLASAIKSVIEQTYTNWELLIVDNYSTDNTNEVIAGFADERIRTFYINNKGIIAVSRNKGIQEGGGEWICFLDADDSWTANKLSTCIRHANDDVDLIHHDLFIAGRRPAFFESKVVKGRKLTKPLIADLLINGNAINNSSVMVRKKLLSDVGGINDSREMIATEDYNTWMKIAVVTDKFLYLPISLGFYYIHSQAMSQKNMSDASKVACASFVHHLNGKQKVQYEATLKYISGSYFYQKKKYKNAIEDLRYAFSSGKLSIQVKSLYKLLISLVRSITA